MVRIGAERIRLHLAVRTLGSSRRLQALAFRSEKRNGPSSASWPRGATNKERQRRGAVAGLQQSQATAARNNVNGIAYVGMPPGPRFLLGTVPHDHRHP